LAHNLDILTDELNANGDTKVVSWLPQYHDMGLIGSLLGVLYCGGTGYYQTPESFIERPMSWLEAASELQATHLQAPNFSFGLCSRKFNPAEYYKGIGGTTVNEDGYKVKPFDLSCLKHVLNGAEPVTGKSVAAFEKAFSPFGLPEGVIYPSYGLAEHTVFVCSGGKGKITVSKKELEEENKVVVVEEMGSTKSEGTIHFLGCGFPSKQGVDVRIVDPVSRGALSDGMVGEIWISSPSKARGYYGKDWKETNREFNESMLEGKREASTKSGGYLRSGDLGFLHEGQLYLCGRIKDLIIVGGRNLYPQDIEATAEEVASEFIRSGCSAAFSICDKGEEEAVVLVMELKEPLPKAAKREIIADMVLAEVFKEHSLSLSCIVLVKPKTVPKTTSGKIQRSEARKQYSTRKLQLLHQKKVTGDVGDKPALALASDALLCNNESSNLMESVEKGGVSIHKKAGLGRSKIKWLCCGRSVEHDVAV
jgi:acyl-CoA synthetase (AMP-forming)/AMP-acid ligase II